jgi:hypothetical protein
VDYGNLIVQHFCWGKVPSSKSPSAPSTGSLIGVPVWIRRTSILDAITNFEQLSPYLPTPWTINGFWALLNTPWQFSNVKPVSYNYPRFIYLGGQPILRFSSPKN